MKSYKETIESKLKSKGLKKKWLAESLGMRYATFWERMKKNNFSAGEKSDVEKLLAGDSDAKARILAKAQTQATLKKALNESRNTKAA